MKKRKLRRWVVVSIEVLKSALVVGFCIVLVGCFFNAWADAHYERLARYGEVAVHE